VAVDTLNGERKRRFLPASVRELSRGVVPLFFALGLLNASNYIFHVAVSRSLGPKDYGELAAILGLLMVLSVPLGVAQTVVAKRTSLLRTEDRHVEIGQQAIAAAKGFLVVGVLGLVAFSVASPLLAAFLNAETPALLLLGPYWLFSLALTVPLGVLQGQLRFSAVAVIALSGVAARLIVGIGLVWAEFGVTGAVAGTVVAQVVSLALTMRLLRLDRDQWRATRASLDPLRGEFRIALWWLGLFWLLAEVDIVLARRWLDSASAGFYASAGLVARALLFLPAAVSIIALPRFSEVPDAREAHRRLKLALGAVGGLVGIALVLLIVFREPVVFLAFGSQFAPAAHLLPLLALGMVAFALIKPLVYFHIARGTRAYRIIAFLVVLEVAAIATFHRSPQEIGFVVLAIGPLALLLLYAASVGVAQLGSTGREPSGDTTPPRAPDLALSVVLPCHNAGNTLPTFLRGLMGELSALPSWEIIIVSDGSTDETVSVANEFTSERVLLIDEPLHIGKGHALRIGMSRARGRYVAFMDADGDIDARVIRPAMTIADTYEPDVVLGSKRHPLSEVGYPPIRRLLSWIYHRMCRLLFRIHVRDTQTGFKIFRHDVLAAVLPRMLEKRYAFDLEFLVVARALGYDRVFEAPIRLSYRFASHISLRASSRILVDTLGIWYRRYILGTYAPQVAPERWYARPNARRRRAGRPFGAAEQEPLRVLILNWRDILNPDAGGAEVFTHEVARRWARSGHDVTLWTSRFPGAPRSEVLDGVHIRRMGVLRRGSFHLHVQRSLAVAHKFDVIIDEINTLPFLTPMWRRRFPAIALIHQLAADVWDAEAAHWLAAVGKRAEPRLLRLYSDLPVVTVSDSTKTDLMELGLKEIHVIPNGRDDTPELQGVELESVPTFLFVGRLTKNKRPDHAIEAFRHIRAALPASRLWIIGRGPMERQLAAGATDGIEMLGRVSRTELYQRMARAHCLLMPSVREGWGLVVVEAASVGTPTIAYDVPGLRDSIIQGETGILVESGDPHALAREAVAVATSPRTLDSMGEAARRWAERFSWDSTANRLMAVVREALDGDGSPSPAPASRETVPTLR
jgi:glycosyltransferase involved in cell wall biosynthesis/O-antigen/teichoic acid export membrane protein